MTKIDVTIKSLILSSYQNGLFVFVGIDEFNNKIFEIIEPISKCDIFYYNCGNRFIIDIVEKFMTSYVGTIIFVNGIECFIYTYDTKFELVKHLNANLVKRQSRGGSSSNRFARIAEESRYSYTLRIIDVINKLETNNNWIFGSKEIIDMLLEENKKKLKFGGFLEFNKDTINETSKWITYLNINYDKFYEKIIFLLETNPDKLEFSSENKEHLEFYIDKKNNKSQEKEIILDKNSPYYEKLKMFDFIGVKFFNYETFE